MKELLLSSAIRKALLVTVPVLVLTACGGDDGKNGEQGAIGTQGERGLAGTVGADGAPGADGADGAPGADGSDGADGADGANGADGADARTVLPMAAGLTRIATVPLGAEVTGAYLTEEGDLFFNAQHPSSENDEEDAAGNVYDRAVIGVLSGVNFNQLPKNLISSPIPDSDQEKETVMAAYGTYQVLAKTGDLFPGTPPNGIGSILSADGALEVVQPEMVDFNGFVSTGTNTGLLFTNWEYFPGGMSRMELTKNPETHNWTVGNVDMLNFGAWGTIANCFGSMSPWGTPLTSEEWGNRGDNTQDWNQPGDNSARDEMARYIDSNATGAADSATFPNTYRYHYIVEITDPAGTATPVKHYAMGRYEHENSIVMPDQRTVYLSQDNTDGVLFKFVADNAGDLSAGTLYAAKLTQDAGSNDPATTGFDIEWIELANSNFATIDAWIAQYDEINLDDWVDGKSSYLTDADAMAWAAEESNYPSYDSEYAPAVAAGFDGANQFGGLVTAGAAMDDRIAFLESRKAARAKGATDEWRKFEGIYANADRAEEAETGTDLIPGEEVTQAYVYFAISDLDRGMIDGEGDIQLSSRVKDCGGIYRMPLIAGYDTARIEPVIMGATYRSSLDGADRCDANGLSQPDNVIVMQDGRILIGEDGGQTNNTLWMYDPKVND